MIENVDVEPVNVDDDAKETIIVGEENNDENNQEASVERVEEQQDIISEPIMYGPNDFNSRNQVIESAEEVVQPVSTVDQIGEISVENPYRNVMKEDTVQQPPNNPLFNTVMPSAQQNPYAEEVFKNYVRQRKVPMLTFEDIVTRNHKFRAGLCMMFTKDLCLKEMAFYKALGMLKIYNATSTNEIPVYELRKYIDNSFESKVTQVDMARNLQKYSEIFQEHCNKSVSLKVEVTVAYLIQNHYNYLECLKKVFCMDMKSRLEQIIEEKIQSLAANYDQFVQVINLKVSTVADVKRTSTIPVDALLKSLISGNYFFSDPRYPLLSAELQRAIEVYKAKVDNDIESMIDVSANVCKEIGRVQVLTSNYYESIEKVKNFLPSEIYSDLIKIFECQQLQFWTTCYEMLLITFDQISQLASSI